MKDVLNTKITKLVFKLATKDLFVSIFYLDSLTLVPKVTSRKDIQISLDETMMKQQLQRAEVENAHITPYETPLQFNSPVTPASRQVAEIQTISVGSLQ